MAGAARRGAALEPRAGAGHSRNCASLADLFKREPRDANGARAALYISQRAHKEINMCYCCCPPPLLRNTGGSRDRYEILARVVLR